MGEGMDRRRADRIDGSPDGGLGGGVKECVAIWTRTCKDGLIHSFIHSLNLHFRFYH